MSDNILKVRCIKTSFTLGKEYQANQSKYCDNLYAIEDDMGILMECDKSRFEVMEEDKQVKEYTLQEIFDLPEGIEFINGDAHFEINDGVLYNWFKPKDKQSVRLTKMYVNMKFIKVENPVSFMEAIESGQKIRIENPIIYKIYNIYKNDENNTYMADLLKDILNDKYHYLNNIIYALSGHMGCSEWKELIKNGKFYLEENE